tara:strand:+ start:391 stop:1035 length:645 start_codon:yes stop_codon:yes gene_type:complete
MKEKNTILNYFIWFVVILIVTVGSLIIFGSDLFNDEEITPYSVYNSYVIYEVKDDKSLRYKVEAFANGGLKYVHNFKNYPEDLLNLNYENDLKDILYEDKLNKIQKSKIYFSYDPQLDGGDVLTAGTLIQILGTGDVGIFKIPVVVSVTEDNGNEDFLVINCEDSNEEIGVILLKKGEPKIYKDKDCIIIQGNDNNQFRKLTDLLSYILLGVIE